ncbi:MAG: nucleotidyltransferase domain-containing protein [Methylococcaceae bacterium]|nr:nucleotidyltransferase domain-containing protein [Methylococcaceae bacterium]
MSDMQLPQDVDNALADFVDAAKSALGPELVSVVLFGSAAEGKLRASSDVNLIVILNRFDPDRIDALREPLRLAHALIQLSAMFLLESEIASAAEAFAVKFSDIAVRHRVLTGADPFLNLAPTRPAQIGRLKQNLLNFILRMRERYALLSLREEQLATVVADAAGPLRAAAALLLSLEGRAAKSPKAALELLAAEIDPAGWRGPLECMSKAREEQTLRRGEGTTTLLYLIGLAQALHARAEALR